MRCLIRQLVLRSVTSRSFLVTTHCVRRCFPTSFCSEQELKNLQQPKEKKKNKIRIKAALDLVGLFFFIKSFFTWHYVTSLVSVRMVMQIFVIIYQIDSCLLVFVTIVTLEEFISFFIFSFNISVCKGFHHNFLLHLAILYLLWFQRNWYFHDQDETKSQ